MQKQAMIAQQQLQSQQMAGQAALQKIQAQTDSQIKIKQSEIGFEVQKLQQEAQLKSQLMAQEFGYKQQMYQAEMQSLNSKDTIKEDAKSQRISQQNTQQSKLINQRKNNLPPLNFESNEDSLDGFDLSEFEPR